MTQTIPSRIGKRYSRLIVLSFSQTKSGNSYWLCRCDCGQEKEVAGFNLTSGNVRSCGCLRKETQTVTHGGVGTKEYRAWIGMKQRVGRPRYMARGISIAPKFKDSFDAFLAELGPMPRPGLTVDRIDNSGDYAPGNVRWATHAEQSRNRTSCRYVLYNGQTLTVTDAAALAGLGRSVVFGRLRRGWSPEKALSTPAR